MSTTTPTERQTPEQVMTSLGFPADKYEGWSYARFNPFSISGSGDVAFSGCPGLNDKFEPLNGMFRPESEMPLDEITEAGKRALAKVLWQLSFAGFELSDYRLHELIVMVGTNPGTPGLGVVADALSDFLLQVFNVDVDDPEADKGIRATLGVSFNFVIEPKLTLVERWDDDEEPDGETS